MSCLELPPPHILERLWERIAFVSDAGMPGISDPGQQLVDAARGGLPVEVVPSHGPSVTALVASGLPSNGFFLRHFAAQGRGTTFSA